VALPCALGALLPRLLTLFPWWPVRVVAINGA
jgi:hypothetical protein